MENEPVRTLVQAVEGLLQDDRILSSGISWSQLAPYCQDVIAHSLKDGFDELSCSELLDLASLQQLSDQSRSSILRAILPRDKVPIEAAVRLLRRVSSFSAVGRADVFRWLVLVLDCIAERDPLHELYRIFFRYLDDDDCRPFLVPILIGLTEVSDVEVFRVRRVLATYARSGPKDADCVSLLGFFKKARPLLPIWRRVPSSDVQPTRRDPVGQLRGHLRRIRVSDSCEKDSSSHLKSDRWIETACTRLSPSAVPLSQFLSGGGAGFALLIPHRLNLFPDDTALLRLDFFLSFSLQIAFRECVPSRVSRSLERRQRVLLSRSCVLARFFGEIPPAVERFLLHYIPFWDGKSHMSSFCVLIAYLRHLPFEQVYSSILGPLNTIAMTSSPARAAALLSSRVSLIRNWASLSPRESSFGAKAVEQDFMRLLYETVKDAETLALSLQLRYPRSVLIHHSALSLAWTMVGFPGRFRLPFVVTPSRHFLRLSLLAGSFSCISVSGIVASLKGSFVELKKSARPATLSFGNGLEMISSFNEELLEFCNLLWRDRLFSSAGDGEEKTDFDVKSSLVRAFKEISGETGDSCASALSLTHSPFFCSFSWRFLRDHNREGVTVGSLKSDSYWRLRFAEMLQREGLDEICNFLNEFIAAFARRS